MDPRRKKWQLVKLSFCTFGASAHLGGKCCHGRYVDEWIPGGQINLEGAGDSSMQPSREMQMSSGVGQSCHGWS